MEQDYLHYNGLERFVDLFSGIGGFRLGLQNVASVRCLYNIDNNSHCANNYECNFLDGEQRLGDIREVKSIPETDLICAGFPCQSFSVSGRSRADDDRNELWREILRLTLSCHRRPKALILENVPRFLVIRQGKDLASFKKAFEDAGYELYCDVLNASEYGIPQTRKRAYFIWLHKDSGLVYHTPYPSFTMFDKAMPYLADIVEPKDAVIDETLFIDNRKVGWWKPGYSDDADIPYRPRPLRIGLIGKGGQGQRVYSVKGHAITQMSNAGGQGAKTGLYLIHGKVRRLTLLEQKRVMGFPDNWIVSSGSKGCGQLGNAVIPNMVSTIYQSITFRKS